MHVDPACKSNHTWEIEAKGELSKIYSYYKHANIIQTEKFPVKHEMQIYVHLNTKK